MAKRTRAELADSIVSDLGGEKNIQQLRHCATRLRVVLHDDDKVDAAALEALPGVISVVKAGGQTQVVIGNDVVGVYQAVMQNHPKLGEDHREDGSTETHKGNPINRFVEIISSIFVPTLGVLAGTGLLKAFLSLGGQLGWFETESSTYIIVNTAADAFFYFLPVMLAYTTARRFKTDVVLALTLGAALVYPALVALMAGDAAVSFFGIPVQRFSYVSSVIPIILAVWGMSHLERFLDRVIPVIVRKFVVPPIVLLIMLPLTLIIVGPVTIFLGNQLAAGVSALFEFSPFLAGAILGGIHQVIVIFGMHWGIIPIMIQEISTTGLSYMLAPIVAAVLGQAAAALAVALKARDKEMRALAASASVSGFLAGITEPAIYGVNLRYKKPFIAALVGGAVGGAIISGGGVAATSFVFPSLLGLPAFMTQGNTVMLFIGCGAATVVAFVLALLLPIKQADGASAAEELARTPEDEVAEQQILGGAVHSPVSGTVIPMEQISDKIFSSGVMGATVGVLPDDGRFISPVAGTVVTAPDSGHAYGIISDGGVEVLVHIGIDTVELKGAHFDRKVAVGDAVGVGDLLAVADLASIRAAGYDTTTIVVVTNARKFESVDTVHAERVRAGELLLSATAAPHTTTGHTTPARA